MDVPTLEGQLLTLASKMILAPQAFQRHGLTSSLYIILPGRKSIANMLVRSALGSLYSYTLKSMGRLVDILSSLGLGWWSLRPCWQWYGVAVRDEALRFKTDA